MPYISPVALLFCNYLSTLATLLSHILTRSHIYMSSSLLHDPQFLIFYIFPPLFLLKLLHIRHYCLFRISNPYSHLSLYLLTPLPSLHIQSIIYLIKHFLSFPLHYYNLLVSKSASINPAPPHQPFLFLPAPFAIPFFLIST